MSGDFAVPRYHFKTYVDVQSRTQVLDDKQNILANGADDDR